jgi:hypothetical protein
MIVSRQLRDAAALGWRFAAVFAFAATLAILLTARSDQFGSSNPPAAPATPGKADKPIAEAPPEARDARYSAIAAYPLFYPTRAPWTPPPPEPPPPEVTAPSTLSGYNLVGVVESGDKRTALIRQQAQPVVILSEGQAIEGWTLKKITPDRLYFSAAEASYEMTRPKPSEIHR